MKKLLLIIGVSALLLSCEHAETDVSESKTVTFALTGDFQLSTHPFTRALEADGKQMTDIWIFDYQDGELKQQIRQSDNTATDFGRPEINLAFGEHHVYCVVSRGQSATLDTEEHTITFGRVLDTFWTDYSVSVSAATPSTATVTLNRVVTKLAISPVDAIPAGTSRVDITPHTWYYGLDYMTGAAVYASTDEPVSINIPSEYAGTTTSFVVWGFSGSTEWTTGVTVESFDGSENITSSVTIPSAPFVCNRVTAYSGNLWTVGSGMTLSLNMDWSDSYNGTW